MKRKNKEPDERLQEIGEAYGDDQFVGCGLIFCVTCGSYTNEDELEAHKGHELARRPGEVLTKKVIRRMRGNGEA